DLNGDGRADLLLQPKKPGGKVTVLLANARGEFSKISAQWSTEKDGRDWSAESYRLVPDPAATPGKGSSLLLVPKEKGLPYGRARFNVDGKLAGVTEMASPPAALFSASGDASSSMSVRARPLNEAVGATAESSTQRTPGTLPGKFSVGRLGAANYKIPIAVAPGVNGMQPKLAIAYSSRGGQTQLGLGWALSGLSAVSRCPATIAADGYSAPVTVVGSGDQFCLGSAHLLMYPGQPNGYGGNNTRYHTPVTTFEKIISNGTQGNGPKSFTVKTKSGLTRVYGSASDALIQGGQDYANTAIVWLLHKVTDRWGNFIAYHYTKSHGQAAPTGSDTSYELTEIDYGNGAGTTVG